MAGQSIDASFVLRVWREDDERNDDALAATLTIIRHLDTGDVERTFGAARGRRAICDLLCASLRLLGP